MDKALGRIKTGEELVKYLTEHTTKNIPYTPEEQEYILKLLKKFGLSKNVLRTHYDIPKDESTSGQ